MELGGIAGTQRCCNASLGIGSCAVEQRALGENKHLTLLRRAPRGMEAGNAGTDDQKAGAEAVGHVIKIVEGSHR